MNTTTTQHLCEDDCAFGTRCTPDEAGRPIRAYGDGEGPCGCPEHATTTTEGTAR